MKKTLDEKLSAIHADPGGCGEFILADAKDADMGFGVTAPGLSRTACSHEVDPPEGCYKTLEDYRAQIRAVIRQGLVDIVLLSAYNLEQIAMRERLFEGTRITPAARANDNIIRCLAGVTLAGRPIFLKIPYNGPGPLEELAAYDPHLIVGILGGGAGTTMDAFQLLHDARKHGARVALYGRKINLSEHPLAFIEFLRRIADGQIDPVGAVKAYHEVLKREKIRPIRALHADLQLSNTINKYG